MSFQIKSNDGVVVAEGDHKQIVSYSDENAEGSLLVKGTSVFKEYWRKPDATKETFDENGWFITGKLFSSLTNGITTVAFIGLHLHIGILVIICTRLPPHLTNFTKI